VHSARAAPRGERPLVRVRSIDRFVTGVTTGLAGVIELSTLAGLEPVTSQIDGLTHLGDVTDFGTGGTRHLGVETQCGCFGAVDGFDGHPRLVG
jgi:hypothetical protein